MWLLYFLWLISLVQCLSFSLMSMARLMGSATSAEGRPVEFCFHSPFLISLEFKGQQPKCTSTSRNWNFSCLTEQTLKNPQTLAVWIICIAICHCYLSYKKKKKTSAAIVLASCMKLFLMSLQTSICILCLSYKKLWFPYCICHSITYKYSSEWVK